MKLVVNYVRSSMFPQQLKDEKQFFRRSCPLWEY